MKLALYIVGGLLLWLGVYGYLKSRNFIGYSPIPGTPADLAFQLCGLLGRAGLLAYVVGMVIIFEWWYAPAFFVVAGVMVGVLYSRLAPYGAGLAIVCVPIGIAITVVAVLI